MRMDGDVVVSRSRWYVPAGGPPSWLLAVLRLIPQPQRDSKNVLGLDPVLKSTPNNMETFELGLVPSNIPLTSAQILYFPPVMN
jgi:hypothetical protein